MLPLWQKLQVSLHDVLPVANKNRCPTVAGTRKTTWRKFRCEIRGKTTTNLEDMALDGEESTPVPNLALEAIVRPALREVIF